jgi:hypothetical protein
LRRAAARDRREHREAWLQAEICRDFRQFLIWHKVCYAGAGKITRIVSVRIQNLVVV